MKKSLVIGATLAAVTLGAGGIGVVSAATDSTTSGTSIVDKIASKFNLNRSDVQAVFDQNRADHEAQMKADMQARLKQAVTDGKLTQAQADHITQVHDEIDVLRGTTAPKDLSDSVRQQIKAKRDDLRQWAKDNNIDMQYVGPMGHGRGGPGRGPDAPASVGTSSSSSSTTSQ